MEGVELMQDEVETEEGPGAADPEDRSDKEDKERMKEIEENPPESLEDWPDDANKYKTIGGPDADTGYEEGPTAKLGPSGVQHHEDGSVSVDGEKVDDPDQYKGEPIPGGPTDPDSKKLSGERDLSGAGDGDDDDDDDKG
jgi:hypothetical protein